ncbi:MAG: hypothetical protein ACRENA_09020 [Vulcanimicrobiaceae bacterium]
MDARKAAAVSAVGMMLVAGCGGKGGGGSSLPTVPGQVNRGVQPANTSKISLAFSFSTRESQTWPASSQTGSPRRVRYGRTTKLVQRHTLATRQPKLLSPAVLGGSVSVYVYQGANLALTQGPFSVGTSANSDIYCYAVYGYPFECYSNAPVFAPYGTDTFFVSIYDSQHHLLSITPDMPGTNFVAIPQPSYNITASGYPYPIAVSTLPVISTFAVESASSCLPAGFGQYTDTALVDGGGYLFIAGQIANPITVTTSGAFSLFDFYTNAMVPTPYTIYTQYVPFEWSLYAQTANATGSVSISSAAGTTLINGSGANMNLYVVDRLALSPAATGLTALGIVDAAAATYQCGTINVARFDTGAPITFSSNALITGDDSLPGVAVVDNASGTPVGTGLNLEPVLFGLGFETYRFQNAIPAFSENLPGSNPLDIGVSPYLFGSAKVYVLNADGSIVSVGESTGAAATVEPAGSINGPVGLTVQYTGPAFGSDSLLMTTTSNTLYEVDNANSAPALSSFLLSSSASVPVSGSATATAVAADLFSGQGSMLMSGRDPLGSPQDIALSCFYPCSTNSSLNATPFGSVGQSAEPVRSIGFESVSGNLYALFASGSQVLGFYNFFDSQPALAGVYGAFGSNVTSVISTYDGLWAGIGYGGLFVFNYQMGGTTVYTPALTGTNAVIVSP